MRRILAVTALVLAHAGCLPPAQQTTVPTKQTFNFDFAAKQSSKLGSANMSLALVNPYYATAFTDGSGELFRNFQSAMGKDIEELVIAKGFTLKGPYQSHDEMIFEDKKRTEILIQIEIAPQFTAFEGGWKANTSILGAAYSSYTYSGKVSLIGKINLSGVEPLTNEKIWSKSVLIPPIEGIVLQSSHRYSTTAPWAEIRNDPGIYNALGTALQAQYNGIMEKVAMHFNAEEFTSLKTQIKELKSKKGY
jgi:hypothetical protein